MDEFDVKIDAFDGPLDLMLHLIRENKLDLMNLDMNVLTDQYIAYLQGMKELHLEIAGEYLAEMAILIEYKSRKMIPGNKDEMEAEEEEDPKDKLVRRLLEYQQYKEAAQQLNTMFQERQELMSRPLSNEVDEFIREDDSQKQYHGSPYELMKAMERCLRRMRLDTPQEKSYTVHEVSMEDRELEVRAKLDHLPQTFRFEKLLDDVHDVPMFIATFLSVLDLARLHTLFFTVDDDQVIWFTRGERYA